MISSAVRTELGYVVPGNRWDLLDGVSAPPRRVSVVVPYYEQPHQLSLMIGALEAQSHPSSMLELIVADDGSAVAPTPVTTLDATVVRQEDRGFRAAAARNLGARTATGDILVFLDADTVPEPGYVEAIVRLPSLVPDALTVGRRRHADLSALGRLPGESDPVLPEPQWLVDAYAGSRDLLDADSRSYRHVISAVMCCSRAFFDELGGFDESFVGYGGEDWELANRAYLAGAVFAHVPRAVAWHDGPDWAGRQDDARAAGKNREAMSLSPLVTDPAARTHAVRYEIPDVVAVVHADGHTPASLLVTVGSILAYGDVGVWVQGADADAMVGVWGAQDSRIRIGAPTGDEVRRSRFGMELRGRIILGSNTIDRLVGHSAGRVETVVDGGMLRWWSWRAVHRARRWAAGLETSVDDAVRDLFGTATEQPDDIGVTTGPRQPDLSW